ncbi:unnamed protein product [Protopolystoma xenopodis]|uniref:Uncharacterized protein n=1 Tax=Protopolystoma xenopodis TaxID=117903 RepID=A0A3S5FG89_9PLAT|nr:unnamed protein product [Protopolystoma xenopodis]
MDCCSEQPLDRFVGFRGRHWETVACSGPSRLELYQRMVDAFWYANISSPPWPNGDLLRQTWLISLVNDSFRILSASRMSSSRSNISNKALTAFSPELFVYMDCKSKVTNSSDPTSPMFWII